MECYHRFISSQNIRPGIRGDRETADVRQSDSLSETVMENGSITSKQGKAEETRYSTEAYTISNASFRYKFVK